MIANLLKPFISNLFWSFFFQRPIETPVLWIIGLPHSGTSIHLKLIGKAPSVYSIRGESRLAFKFPTSALYELKAIESLAIGNKCSWLLEKTPSHLLVTNRLRKLAKNSHFLITIRRPSSLFASILYRRLDYYSNTPSGLIEVSFYLSNYFRFIITLLTDFPEAVFVSRLEKLIKNRDEHLREICQWMNLDVSDADLIAIMTANSSGVDFEYSATSSDVNSQSFNLSGDSLAFRQSDHELRRDIQVSSGLFVDEVVLNLSDLSFIPKKVSDLWSSLDELLGY